MARYRFGRGEYQYFNYPLPHRIDELRHQLYGELVNTARDWTAALSRTQVYPQNLAEFLNECKSAGQQRPTPLLLHYREGDFNCLHQDLYGEVFFPFQVVICLSRPIKNSPAASCCWWNNNPALNPLATPSGWSKAKP